jgi:hypothetical protein
MIQTVYGAGGFCENCDTTHDHPLHNIIEQSKLLDTESTLNELARQSAIDKLSKLGLTVEEVVAIGWVSNVGS